MASPTLAKRLERRVSELASLPVRCRSRRPSRVPTVAPRFRGLGPTLSISVLLALGSGCERGAEGTTEAKPDRAATVRPANDLETAKRMLELRDFEGSAEAASKALLRDPQDLEVRWVLSQAEAGRGRAESALEYAESIDLDSRFGIRAIELRCQQLIKLDRINQAAETRLAGLTKFPNQHAWRRHAWALLNQVGRRYDASEQALALCKQGIATEAELLSLVSRGWSFPTPRMVGEDFRPKQRFRPGLGMARWHLTKQDFRAAIDQLRDESETGFSSEEARALYGRLLAETQSFGEIPGWYRGCTEATSQYADYWAALGVFLFDQREYEASARALLEATSRDPTDRFTVQRLSKVFAALDRNDDSEQFRHRGVKLSDSELAAERLFATKNNRDLRLELTNLAMELGRPFETLNWSLLMMPSGATAERNAVHRQRESFLRNADVLAMSVETALFEIDPAEFDLVGALKGLSADDGEADSGPKIGRQLARPRLTNVAAAVGLVFQWYKDFEIDLASIPIHESLGGGIAVLDYDQDGWPDVFFAQGSGEPPSDACSRSHQLFQNRSGSFFEVTAESATNDTNYGAGLAAGDVNQDGFPDLFLASLGRNRLLINNGDGTFRDATERLGPFRDRFSTSVAIADLNGDGLPELFEANYIEMEGAFVLPQKGAGRTAGLARPAFALRRRGPLV